VQCEKKGVICKGYEKVLKWRPQEDAFKNKTGPPQPRKSRFSTNEVEIQMLTLEDSTSVKLPRQHSTSPSPSYPSPPPTSTPSLAHQTPFQQPPILLDSRPSQQIDSLDDNEFGFENSTEAENRRGTQPIQIGTDSSFGSSTASLINGGYEEDATPQSAQTIASSLWSDSPRMSNTVPGETDLNLPSPNYITSQSGNSAIAQISHGLPDFKSFPYHDEEEVEEIVREPDAAESWLVPLMSPSSSDSSGSSSGSWVDTLTANIWSRPQMHHDSEETLMLLFDRQTCGILSIKDGPSENPWRTMLWPLAREDEALRHAITSMTAFHASKENPRLRIKGIEHMSQSLQLLSRGIGSMPLITSLATTLVLAFCESWDTLISTGIRHLRGASHLVAEIMTNYRQGTTFPENEPRLGFLCKTWVYMDVIARLTSLEGDDSTNFDIVDTSLCQAPVIRYDMDPLMGCATSLFPTIGRVANLVREIRQRTHDNSLQIISQARDLKSSLEKWKSPSAFNAPEDAQTEVEQGLWTAEAYRGATLLYLLQAVPEISYDSVTEAIAAMAKEVLTHIANVPVTSGMVIIHIFPLLAAGCEAVDQETRLFVIERWQTMMRRMKIQNLDRCLDVVKEVWDRRDQALLEKQRRKARLAASSSQTGYLPTTIMKRKHSSVDGSAPNSPRDGKRRAMQSPMNWCSSTPKPEFLRRESTTCCSGLDYELTVRGRQHWAGVMKDLQWEGES